jgi:hypothetical protein
VKFVGRTKPPLPLTPLRGIIVGGGGATGRSQAMARRVNGGRQGDVRRREEEEGGFMAGREAPPARIHGGRQASPCGRRASCGTSGTRGALKAMTDGGRVIIKYADRRPHPLTRGAGVSVASCRVLPVLPIGSCRAGAGAGVPAIFLGSMACQLVLGGTGAALF